MFPMGTGTFFEVNDLTFTQYRASYAERARNSPLWRAWAELIERGLPLYVAKYGSADLKVKKCVEGGRLQQ